MMEFKLYEHRKHFREVYRWWKAHRKSPLDIESLSPYGVMVCEGEKMLACSWVYLAKDCLVAQIGWSVSNPDIPFRKAHEAIQASIKESLDFAQRNGYHRVMTVSSSRGLTRAFKRQGFTPMIPHDLLVKVV
jgi:hypothetical protein